MNTLSEIEEYYKAREQQLLKKLHQQEAALAAAEQTLKQLTENQKAPMDETTEQRAARERAFKDELYRDPLTGIYNRRYYEEVARKTIGPAVVGSCQRVPVKLFFELLLPCSMPLGGFVLWCSLIFGQLFQLLIRCGKGGFLFVKLFDQPLLALFVVALDLGKCIHVLTFSCIIYIVCVLPLRKRACPLFIFGGG